MYHPTWSISQAGELDKRATRPSAFTPPTKHPPPPFPPNSRMHQPLWNVPEANRLSFNKFSRSSLSFLLVGYMQQCFKRLINDIPTQNSRKRVPLRAGSMSAVGTPEGLLPILTDPDFTLDWETAMLTAGLSWLLSCSWSRVVSIVTRKRAERSGDRIPAAEIDFYSKF